MAAVCSARCGCAAEIVVGTSDIFADPRPSLAALAAERTADAQREALTSLRSQFDRYRDEARMRFALTTPKGRSVEVPIDIHQFVQDADHIDEQVVAGAAKSVVERV